MDGKILRNKFNSGGEIILNKKTLSIIIPMYNEEESLPLLYDRLTKLADNIKDYDIEFLFHKPSKNFIDIRSLREIRSIEEFRQFCSKLEEFE